VVRGWEKAVHMPSCVTYVTKKHFMLVKQTLTYIIRGRGEQDSGGERGRGKYKGKG